MLIDIHTTAASLSSRMKSYPVENEMMKTDSPKNIIYYVHAITTETNKHALAHPRAACKDVMKD